MAELSPLETLDEVDVSVGIRTDGCRVLALVAPPTPESEDWAPRAAHRLAAQWVSKGHRVILADGGLDQPSLHNVAGIPNREGIVDVALYGASLARVSQLFGGYVLITAGTVVADPTAVARARRWHRVAAGVPEAGATLLIYLRDEEPWAPAFLDSVDEIVFLKNEGELPTGYSGPNNG